MVAVFNEMLAEERALYPNVALNDILAFALQKMLLNYLKQRKINIVVQDENSCVILLLLSELHEKGLTHEQISSCLFPAMNTIDHFVLRKLFLYFMLERQPALTAEKSIQKIQSYLTKSHFEILSSKNNFAEVLPQIRDLNVEQLARWKAENVRAQIAAETQSAAAARSPSPHTLYQPAPDAASQQHVQDEQKPERAER